MKKIIRPRTHPGGILKRQCMEPLSLSISKLAKILGVSRNTLSRIINEQGSITPSMALRLSKTFGTTPESWRTLQQNYDRWYAAQKFNNRELVKRGKIRQGKSTMLPKNRRPVHPGKIILHEYLEPLNLTQQQLADALGITRVRIKEIILGKRSVTTDTAFRLAKFFNTTPDFWINLQINVDMWDSLQLHKREYDKISSIT